MNHEVRGPGLRAQVDAGRGARIASLRGSDGFEWLLLGTRAATPGTGQPFVRDGMGGWDEVAPTVQADTLPWDGQAAVLSDHGEAWNVPWTVLRSAPERLDAFVDLDALPVRLERSIAATASGLRFEYRAVTSSPEPVPFLWCAHPQFTAEPGAAVELYAGGRSVTPDLVEMYPRSGVRRDFAGTPGPLPAGSSLKAFTDPGAPVDAAVLRRPSGRALRLSWDPGRLPYLGLFWDNGEFAPEPVIAVEPSTAWGERLSDAVREGRAPVVSRERPLSWFLDLRVE